MGEIREGEEVRLSVGQHFGCTVESKLEELLDDATMLGSHGFSFGLCKDRPHNRCDFRSGITFSVDWLVRATPTGSSRSLAYVLSRSPPWPQSDCDREADRLQRQTSADSKVRRSASDLTEFMATLELVRQHRARIYDRMLGCSRAPSFFMLCLPPLRGIRGLRPAPEAAAPGSPGAHERRQQRLLGGSMLADGSTTAMAAALAPS